MAAIEAYAFAFIGAVAVALEVAAAFVIAFAALRAFLAFLPASVRRDHDEGRTMLPLRHRFGRSLLLGLDFAIGSDILKTAIAPTMDGVLVTGLVVVIRTVLTLVLEHELARDEKRERAG